MGHHFHSANTQVSVSSPDLIRLSAKPKTDIYAAPAHGYVFSAPVVYQKITSKDFKSAGVIVSFNYSYTYDQGGLLLVFPSQNQPSPDSTNSGATDSAPRWVKAGIEVNQGVPQVSVVGREGWADWSLGTLPRDGVDERAKSARLKIKMERHGNALAISVAENPGTEGSWRLIREIQWVFTEESENCWMGLYVARPDAKGEAGGQELGVTFEGFYVDS